MDEVYRYLNGSDDPLSTEPEARDIFSSTIENYTKFISRQLKSESQELTPDMNHRENLRAKIPSYFYVNVSRQKAPVAISKLLSVVLKLTN
jgi:hypothetical protein